MRPQPTTEVLELHAAGERLLNEVMVIVDGGNATRRGHASPETVSAAETALARYKASEAPNTLSDELADALSELLPIVRNQEHPERDERAGNLYLALYHHSYLAE